MNKTKGRKRTTQAQASLPSYSGGGKRRKLASSHLDIRAEARRVQPGASDSERSQDDNDEQLGTTDLPLEVLERLRRDGVGPSRGSALKAAREAASMQYKRLSKHMPAEESAKRPVPRFRELLQVAKRQHRDPRYDERAGAYDKDRFMKQFSFLYNEVLPAERDELKRQLKRAKSEEEAAVLKVEIGRVHNKLLEHRNRQQHQKIEKEVKAQEKEAVKEGKQRFYTKKSEVRKHLLLEKYKELEKSGKLEKFMAKRRKKNAAKDHKRVPRPQQ